MKKILLILGLVFLILLSLPVITWWMTLQPSASVINTAKISQSDLSRIHQFIQKKDQRPSHNHIQLPEQDLNQLLQYGSQQLHLPIEFAAHVNLHHESSQLLLSLNTFLPLRPFLNIRIDFKAEGKNIILLGGQIGSIELPQQSVAMLINMSMPYARQHPQYSSGTQLWQTIQNIAISDDLLSVDFVINKKLQAELQQKQLELIVGKTALERLPFYQQAIESQFAHLLGKREKLYRVMKHLFTIGSQQQQQGADPIADNKAIILALFLHTVKAEDFALLELNQSIHLPQLAIEFTIERQKDLAQHFLSTATITLFANSTIADAIGLQKELQDQNGFSGFSVTDLLANRVGSLLATQLLSNPQQAAKLQQKLANINHEQDFFPNTKPFASQLEALLSSNPDDQENLLNTIDQRIDEYARSVAIYQ